MELRDIRGIGPTYDQRLVEAGVRDAEDLAWVHDLSTLSAKTGIPPARLAEFQVQAVRMVADRHRPPKIALRGAAAAVWRLREEVVRAVGSWRKGGRSGTS